MLPPSRTVQPPVRHLAESSTDAGLCAPQHLAARRRLLAARHPHSTVHYPREHQHAKRSQTRYTTAHSSRRRQYAPRCIGRNLPTLTDQSPQTAACISAGTSAGFARRRRLWRVTPGGRYAAGRYPARRGFAVTDSGCFVCARDRGRCSVNRWEGGWKKLNGRGFGDGGGRLHRRGKKRK